MLLLELKVKKRVVVLGGEFEYGEYKEEYSEELFL